MKGTVLLVEDERDTRELLSAAIERAGFRCVPATGARDALERAAGAGFVDVVVTDVVLGPDDRGGLRLIADELRSRRLAGAEVLMMRPRPLAPSES